MNHDLKSRMDRLVHHFGPEYLNLDPLELVRKYRDRRDQEVAGMVAAMLAVGAVAQIRKAVGDVLGRMAPSPFSFVTRFDPASDGLLFDDFVYRFYRGRDIGLLILMLQSAYASAGTLEDYFLQGDDDSSETVAPGLSNFVRRLLETDPRPFYSRLPEKGRGLRHFLADPEDGSPCKRLVLFLRWMVRRNPPDLGIWTSVNPSRLVIPVDVHIHRIGRRLGLTSRRNPDWRMALEITESLRHFDPDDPVKYDFALCTLGKIRGCSGEPSEALCRECLLEGRCRRVESRNPAVRSKSEVPRGGLGRNRGS